MHVGISTFAPSGHYIHSVRVIGMERNHTNIFSATQFSSRPYPTVTLECVIPFRTNLPLANTSI